MTSSVLNASFCYIFTCLFTQQHSLVWLLCSSGFKVTFVANDAIILVIPYIAFIRKMEYARKIKLLSWPILYITWYCHIWPQSSVVINQSINQLVDEPHLVNMRLRQKSWQVQEGHIFVFIDLDVYKAEICCYSILDLRTPGRPCYCFSHWVWVDQLNACQIYWSLLDCCPACVDCSRSLRAGLLFVLCVFPLYLLVSGSNKTEPDPTPVSFNHQPAMSYPSSWRVAWSEWGEAPGWCCFCCCLQPESPSVSSQFT